MFDALDGCSARAMVPARAMQAAAATTTRIFMAPPPGRARHRTRPPTAYGTRLARHGHSGFARDPITFRRKHMRLKTLIAIAVGAAFTVPVMTQASTDNDSFVVAQAGSNANKKERPGATSGRTSSATLFDRLDRNKDGYVTRDEARDATELQGRFAELDANNDGKISREEMRAIDGQSGAGDTAPRSGADRAVNPNP